MPRKFYTQDFGDAAMWLTSQHDATLEAGADELGIPMWSHRRLLNERLTRLLAPTPL